MQKLERAQDNDLFLSPGPFVLFLTVSLKSLPLEGEPLHYFNSGMSGILKWLFHAGYLEYKSCGCSVSFPPLAFNFTTNVCLLQWDLCSLVSLMQLFSTEYAQ